MLNRLTVTQATNRAKLQSLTLDALVRMVSSVLIALNLLDLCLLDLRLPAINAQISMLGSQPKLKSGSQPLRK